MLKRLIDIILSLVLMLLLLPLYIMVYLWVKNDSIGPAIFKQQRIGLNGQCFDIYKFRTMVVDAEKKGGFSTQKSDSRITNAGYKLRNLSLDEMPQLWNVLIGDMSVIGPRPDVPAQKSKYSEHEWTKRNQVRPGITGLAQATRRSAASAQEKIQLDLEYVDHASLLMDFKILALTLKSLFVSQRN